MKKTKLIAVLLLGLALVVFESRAWFPPPGVGGRPPIKMSVPTSPGGSNGTNIVITEVLPKLFITGLDCPSDSTNHPASHQPISWCATTDDGLMRSWGRWDEPHQLFEHETLLAVFHDACTNHGTGWDLFAFQYIYTNASGRFTNTGSLRASQGHATQSATFHPLMVTICVPPSSWSTNPPTTNQAQFTNGITSCTCTSLSLTNNDGSLSTNSAGWICSWWQTNVPPPTFVAPYPPTYNDPYDIPPMVPPSWWPTGLLPNGVQWASTNGGVVSYKSAFMSGTIIGASGYYQPQGSINLTNWTDFNGTNYLLAVVNPTNAAYGMFTNQVYHSSDLGATFYYVVSPNLDELFMRFRYLGLTNNATNLYTP